MVDMFLLTMRANTSPSVLHLLSSTNKDIPTVKSLAQTLNASASSNSLPQRAPGKSIQSEIHHYHQLSSSLSTVEK